MKSTFLYKLTDETVIEINDTCQGTIDKLRHQTSICSETDIDKRALLFECSKNGKISIKNIPACRRENYRNRMYYVGGEVVSENGKTKIKLYYVYSRAQMIARSLLLLFFIVAFIPLAIFYTVIRLNALPGLMIITILILFIVGVILHISYIENETKNKSINLQLMKREAMRRIEDIKRWDD